MALNNITFPPYNANQLVEILNDRARKALALLYGAALIADEEHSLKIEEREGWMSHKKYGELLVPSSTAFISVGSKG